MISATAKGRDHNLSNQFSTIWFYSTSLVTPGVEKKNVEKGFRFLFGFPQVLGKH